MKSMRKLGWTGALLLALAMSSGAAVARTADLYEPPRILTVGSQATDLQHTRDRIIAAGQSLGWAVVRETPELLELQYDKQGKHQVTVSVSYDTSGYLVRYVTSTNLNYAEVDGQRKIHPNYNRWVRNLIKQIGGQ